MREGYAAKNHKCAQWIISQFAAAMGRHIQMNAPQIQKELAQLTRENAGHKKAGEHINNPRRRQANEEYLMVIERRQMWSLNHDTREAKRRDIYLPPHVTITAFQLLPDSQLDSSR